MVAVRAMISRLLGRWGATSTSTADDDPELAATIAAVAPFTMTSPQRLMALCDAIRYLERYDIPGAVVECGVWAGGSVMAALRTMLALGQTHRDVYLFDTFEGMSQPGRFDEAPDGTAAMTLLSQADSDDAIWCRASLQEVQRNVLSVGYPADRLHFVKGRVEDTVPQSAPAEIALLRLDTDWYESTSHELKQLVPRVCPGGVLIVDDYGHWKGARRAVDEWLANSEMPVLLSRIDYTGRLAVLGTKPPEKAVERG